MHHIAEVVEDDRFDATSHKLGGHTSCGFVVTGAVGGGEDQDAAHHPILPRSPRRSLLQAPDPPIVEAPSAAQATIHAPTEEHARQMVEDAAPSDASDVLGRAPGALVIEGDSQHRHTTLLDYGYHDGRGQASSRSERSAHACRQYNDRSVSRDLAEGSF